MSGARVCPAIVWIKTQTRARTTRGSPREIMSQLSQHTQWWGEMCLQGIPRQHEVKHPNVQMTSANNVKFKSKCANLPLSVLDCKLWKRQTNVRVERLMSVWCQMQADARTFQEKWEATWITQRSNHFDSTAILSQTLAERGLGMNRQSAYLPDTSIFIVVFLKIWQHLEGLGTLSSSA